MSVLADLAARLDRPGVRVAVDGVDCSGKTTLADALARLLPCTRLSVDDFLRPAEERYRRGRDSPEGCYRDSHDLPALRSAVLAVPGRLVVDGVFLARPELADLWDVVVRLECPDEEVLRRAALRDGEQSLPRYRTRYLPAQALYRAEAAPADVVLDTTAAAAPVVLRWS